MLYTTSLLTKSDCYRAARPLTPAGIVIHSTGTKQKRISAYTAQWDRPGVAACVHGFLGLDDQGALCFAQTLPFSMQCWGCGSGPAGSFNASHIQFEICEDLDDGDWCRETCSAALGLCAKLCSAYRIPPEAVVCHSEAHARGFASNHADVMHWWPRHGLDMDRFRKELSDQMLNNDENYEVFKAFLQRWEAEQRALPPADYAGGACARGVAAGVFSDGDGDGFIDWPQAYIKRQELAVVLDRLGALK